MNTTKRSIAAILFLILTFISIFAISRYTLNAEDADGYVTMFTNDKPWYDEVRYGKIKINGEYYVPITFFGAVAGVDVKKNDYLDNVMLTYGRKYITFDTATRDTAYTEEGGSFHMRTYMIRAKTLWIPVEPVAAYLGIHYETTVYNGIDIIRLNNGYAAYTLDALALQYNAPETSQTTSATTETTAPPPITSDTETTEEDHGLGERLIYLTFEDAPNEHTPDILEQLASYGYKATFFLNGNAIAEHALTVRTIIASGHSIGLHTMTQDDAAFRKDFSLLTDEFEAENLLLEKLFKLRTRLIRAPEGSASGRKQITITRENGKTLTDLGYIVWDWNVSVPDDTTRYTIKQAEKIAVDGITEYEIPVLRFHSTERTVQILPAVLEFISANPGFEVRAITPAAHEVNLIGLYE